MTKSSASRVLWMSMRLLSWREWAAMSVAAIFVILGLYFMMMKGVNVGAHIGAKGWFCGQGVKGDIYCKPDPSAPPQAETRQPEPQASHAP